MKKTKQVLPLAAAILVMGCGGSSGSSESSAPGSDGAWMEDATVVVARDEAASRQTVTLVDPRTGFSQVMSDEPLTPDVIEVDDQSPVVAALTWGLSS
jgi:hypothetical protein